MATALSAIVVELVLLIAGSYLTGRLLAARLGPSTPARFGAQLGVAGPLSRLDALWWSGASTIGAGRSGSQAAGVAAISSGSQVIGRRALHRQ